MVETILDAKSRLEAEGLYVSRNDAKSLWIAGSLTDAGEGVRLSQDACALFRKGDQWTVVFPAEGMLTYEMSDSLPELLTTISTAYQRYRLAGGQFKDIFKQVVSKSEQYLVGRTVPVCGEVDTDLA